MMPSAEPLFLTGSAGPLFALYLPAIDGGKRAVLLLPPFVEEMNRARRMLRLQAGRLAEAGIAALLLDPFGTGDSAGDFADARWDIWVADVAVAAERLMSLGFTEIGLLGLRLGAMLAAAAAPRLPVACCATVLWQAATQGKTAIDELLRLRSLPGVLSDGAPTTSDGMRRSLAAGNALEVAGYEISPAMAAALDPLDLEGMGQPSLGEVTWLEIVRDPLLPMSCAGLRCIEAWRARGMTVGCHTVTGPMFWTGQGNALCPALLDTTVAAFNAAP